MRFIVWAAFLAVLAGCAGTSERSNPQKPVSLEEAFRSIQQGKAQKTAIAAFATMASEGNVDGLLERFDPFVRQAAGDDKLRGFLKEKIIPFFSDYQSVDNYENVGRAQFPGGRVGLVHYTYMVAKTGVLKPFTIALIDETDGTRVFDIGVNVCEKSRHPVSKGRCDS